MAVAASGSVTFAMLSRVRQPRSAQSADIFGGSRMMNRVLLLAVAGTILTGTQTCLAADADGYFRTIGVPTCGEFVASQLPSAAPYADIRVGSWIAGYISAYNAQAPDTYDILRGGGMDGARLWLTNYCNAHALDNLSKAMDALVDEGHSQRTIRRPK